MEYKAPEDISNRDKSKPSLFLASSIEMGLAELWQDKVVSALKEEYNIFNPRRNSWNNTWEQSITNPEFVKQVTWELNSLDEADTILFYFDPNTKSPISLLELGIYINTNKILYVVCPKGFYRKGNVDIVCNKYYQDVYEDLNQVINLLKN